MISVCMGTYNGEKYIKEQLHSIWKQTLQPGEVILCDDGSQDKTKEIIRLFIQEHGLENTWKLYENTNRLGYPGNFYHCMELCTGNLVFLSDQDDVWDIRKIERMSQLMEVNPEALVFSCKFGLIDSKGKDIHTLMAPSRTQKNGKVRKVTVEDVFYKCEWPGMVLAYRREWYEREKPVGNIEIPHDFFICARAAEQNGFYQTDEELAWHRRHDNNAGGEEHRISRLLNKERKLQEIQSYQKILEGFAQEKVMRTQRGKKALQDKARVMGERNEALESGTLGQVLKNAWRNRVHTRILTAVCDIAIVRNRK